MRTVARVMAFVGCLAVTGVVPAAAQDPADDSAPPLLQIFREEVKPGKAAAHRASESTWAAAMGRHKMAHGWLGTTSLTGPSEAWFFYGLPSWEQWEKNLKAEEANEAFGAEVDKISAIDGDSLSRTSAILARLRPNMSYQPRVNLAQMRYLRVTMVRVKPGHSGQFVDNWEQVVRAHEKARMDEHWAQYEVVSGMPGGTYMYMQAFKSLADIDKLTPMHEAEGYRTAVGDGGRAKALDVTRDAVDWSMDVVLAFSPKMSYLPKHWVDADPAYWAPPPPKKPAKQ